MSAEFLDRYFIPLFLVIGFSMKLLSSRGTTDGNLRYYWLTVVSTVSTVILIAADALEIRTQGSPELRFRRIFFRQWDIQYVRRLC